MQPITEFRTLPMSSSEPANRASEGTVVGGGSFDLGEVDTTDEAQDVPVRVVWWRVSDMNGNSEICNIRVWLDGTGDFTGTVFWYMDITDTWTAGKTPVAVRTGSPGTAPISEGSPNLSRIGGGTVTGITHDQTTQYIYISGNIGVNETTGEKSALKLMVTYDYR